MTVDFLDYLNGTLDQDTNVEGQPLSVRNNNPGNMRPVGAGTGFQKFESPEAGIDAMHKDLFAKITGNSPVMKSKFGADYSPTISNLISTWAPSSENDTKSYINAVSEKLGRSPDDVLSPDDIPQLSEAMIAHEGGGKASKYFGKGKKYAQADTGVMNDATQVDDVLPDLTKLSDEELDALEAQHSQPQLPDLSKLSDEELDKLEAGIATENLPGLKNIPDVGMPKLPVDNTPQVPFIGNDGKPMPPEAKLPTDDLILKDKSSPDFIDRTIEDWEKRNQQLQDISASDYSGPGGQSIAQTLFQTAGNIGGRFITDPLMNAVGSGGRYLEDLSPTVGKAVRGMGNEIKGDIISSANPGFKDIANYIKSNPALGRDLSAANDLAIALPLAKPTAAVAGDVGEALITNTMSAKKALKPVTYDEFVSKSIEGNTTKAPKDLKKVYDRLRADYPDDADFTKVLEDYAGNSNKTLLELGGERIKNLAEGAAMYPSGGAKATEFFNEATGNAPERLKTAVSKNVSPSTNYYDTLDEMVKVGRKRAEPLYTQAFKANPSVKSKIIDRILDTPEGKSALSEAVKNMQNEMSLVARPDKELTEIAKELQSIGKMEGSGSVGSGLKLKTLDYIKRSMDDTINQSYRTGDEAQARRIINLKNGLVSEMDAADKTKLYAKARKTSGDYLSNKDAMDSGLNFLKDDAEIVARNFKDMGVSGRKAYKTGVVKAIRNQIENANDGRNVATLFQKPATRQKLKSILSEGEYNTLAEEALAVDNIFKLRNQITGNSRTAMRQIAAQEFDNEGAQIAMDMASEGIRKTAAKRTFQWISRRFDGLSDKSAKEVAEMLYEQDPKKKYQIVKALSDRVAKTKGISKNEAAQKLDIFYTLSDAIAESRKGADFNSGNLSTNLEGKSGKPEISPKETRSLGTQDLEASSNSTGLPEPSGNLNTAQKSPESYLGPTINRPDINTSNPSRPNYHDLNDKSTLLDKAQEHLEPTIRLLNDITGDIPGAKVVGARVKDPETVDLKISRSNREPSQISDYLGSRIQIDNPEAADQVIKKLGDKAEIIHEDNFLTGTGRPESGYRAIHLQVKGKDGFSHEVQLIPKELMEVYDQERAVHDKWKDFRGNIPTERVAEYEADMKANKKIFTDAGKRWDKRINHESEGEPINVRSEGKVETAVTPAGDEIKVKDVLVEGDDLIASQHDDMRSNANYPQVLQPRDRSRFSSHQQISRLANNLNPRLLMKNPLTSEGAPIISKDGVVESGNGRVLGIRKAYNENPASAEKYKQALAEAGYDVKGMKKPILVRVRETPMNIEERVKLTQASNERSTSAMSATEQANKDATRLSAGTFEKYLGGDLKAMRNRPFVRSAIKDIVPESEQATIFTKDGGLSQEAERRINNAVLSKAYDDEAISQLLTENSDNELTSLGRALTHIAPAWAKMREAAKSGLIPENMDITPTLVDATKLILRARREGKPLSDYLHTKDLLSDDISQEVRDLVESLHQGNKLSKFISHEKIVNALTDYANEAGKVQPGVNLFGEKPLKPSEILDNSIKKARGEKNEKNSESGAENDTPGKDVR